MIATDLDGLWKEFVRTRSAQLRKLLMEHYLPVVRYQAEKVARKSKGAAETDDLITDGVFGLADAIDAFDPGRNVRFGTFAAHRVRGAILDAIRSRDTVTRTTRRQCERTGKARSRYFAAHGYQPTDEELRNELGLDKDMLKRHVESENIGSSPFSLDAITGENEQGDTQQTRYDDLGEYDDSRYDLREIVLKNLTREEKMIVILYYYEGMTMKEIGQVLELSESRISQMHSSIVQRLRSRFTRLDLV